MIDDLKLYKETYDFLLWLYPEIKKFPKSEKYTLGERLKNTTESLLLNIVLINKNKSKQEYLKKADLDLGLLRILLRLSSDLKVMPFKKYEIASKKVNDMGNLLGGLIKTFK
ncbi:diversity-generating retroelement protein Avd [archaeon]|jgi:four helix bundle protein|nr:diversity-generating retroelement protein Avd [archaeon]MDD2477900.1 diversity-generating retroelement protein Avd [Candidatus ainarchaeum sp.]MDD3084473.1 diversity-generating retroelement protein Avd [Candidatus ainarchaeum sp.]MDD4220935.1 diversity-generating retroelement protein Avd [Candidatus ainarchaeum sp.]MDD4662884.1 diversity-generating retroelement protein Avd [Candidatus ainarchaeum sp.]